MSDSVKISGITLEFPDGTKKELSIDHARQLYVQLDQLLGKSTMPVQPWYPSYPAQPLPDVWPVKSPISWHHMQVRTGTGVDCRLVLGDTPANSYTTHNAETGRFDLGNAASLTGQQ